MEVRVEERLTGRAWRDRILTNYRSRDRLEQAADEPENAQARQDLAMLRLLEERPTRLEETYQTELILLLDPADLDRISPQRIRLLAAVAESKEPLNLTRLTKLLGRDKKNVSQDLHVLASLGLLHLDRVGRDLRPRMHANEIRIVLGAPTTAG